MRSIFCIWALIAALALASSACKRDAESGDRQVLMVFAASSLAESFSDLERSFERANPGVDVQLTFAGSQVLRLQIEQGAPADVFASANEEHMRALVEQDLCGEAHVFAHNELVIITPENNPSAVQDFGELDSARSIIVGAERVPIGIYTEQMFARVESTSEAPWVERVREKIVSKENNVRLVRAKVELGEADAAIVYRTDAVASEKIQIVPVPASVNVRASYMIAPVKRSEHEALAKKFVEHARSDAGQEALKKRGFVVEAR